MFNYFFVIKFLLFPHPHLKFVLTFVSNSTSFKIINTGNTYFLNTMAKSITIYSSYSWFKRHGY